MHASMEIPLSGNLSLSCNTHTHFIACFREGLVRIPFHSETKQNLPYASRRLSSTFARHFTSLCIVLFFTLLSLLTQ